MAMKRAVLEFLKGVLFLFVGAILMLVMVGGSFVLLLTGWPIPNSIGGPLVVVTIIYWAYFFGDHND